MQTDYKIYPTLLDGFTRYLKSEAVYDKLYGFSEEPTMTMEEFVARQKQELIDRINRVPFESYAADRGTVFNELVDCLVDKRRPMPSIEVEKYQSVNEPMLKATFKGQEFIFPRSLVQMYATRYEGALTQQRVSATMETAYGTVELYGVIDELLPLSVHDIKTTSGYSVGKFKDNAQHLVYPYCLLIETGKLIPVFEYNVVEFNAKGTVVGHYTETYCFNLERDIPLLLGKVEELIRFLEENRPLITDRKVFGGENL